MINSILNFILPVLAMVPIAGTNVEEKLNLMHAQYPADFSEDENLVGAADNIFVGKVISGYGNKQRGSGPETQFKVEVVDNIKGELNGEVVVNQQGGYRDGELYVFEGDLFSDNDKESLLQVGSTYLFSTRKSELNNWYTLISYPEANVLLAPEERYITKAEIKEHKRVKELTSAYPKEKHLKADVANSRVRNSYKEKKDAESSEVVEESIVEATIN
jgi:hypothetical protein